MRPAPALLFPPLAAAGTGLLAWLGISIVLLHARADLMPALHALQVAALLLGSALLAAALIGPRLLPDGRPAWPRWREGWAARADLAALAALGLALALFAVLRWVAPGPDRAMVLGLLGLGLAAAALVAISAAALAPDATGTPAEHPLRVPTQLLLALTLGLGLLFCLMAWLLPAGHGEPGMLLTLAVLGLLLAACLLLRWRDLDRGAPVPAGRRGERRVHAALLAAPLACWALALLLPATTWLVLATLALLAAAVLEHGGLRFATEYGRG
ncbi:hypothetical protein E5843_01945 [Luteimonas yindakuii]|uniref:hypothetical protein n=1 Tax=Luteimonas yindakuii TaxID=2565782 RepID=UPI00110764F5|nr:hypothetical protein [Luteimonas yindakuii]QCO66861.2 hypothetical protein E5843_01945 [Luteimonas yindakuii]